MSKHAGLKEFVIEQLEEIPEISVKNMFGGIGFFQAGKMFGMIGGGVFRLKVDQTNLEEFQRYGATAFMSTPEKKGMPYYEVPADILEDRHQLQAWTLKSIKIAHSS